MSSWNDWNTAMTAGYFSYPGSLCHLWPLLSRWINVNPNMANQSPAQRNGIAYSFPNLTVEVWELAEQITVRIVQIMIQATDLAQILYGGHYSRKKRGPRKNFNMAAIFQDGRHRVSWNVIFCLTNGGKWSKKIILTTECMFWAYKMYS